MDHRFQEALKNTIRHEGGYANDPDDPGRETKFGISKKKFPDLNIKLLTIDDAKNIYYTQYWRAPQWFKIENDPIARKMFDLGVNMGRVTAAKILQKACNKLGGQLKLDGIIGPVTIDRVNAYRYPAALLMTVRMLAAQRYFKLGKSKYIAGWLMRLAK